MTSGVITLQFNSEVSDSRIKSLIEEIYSQNEKDILFMKYVEFDNGIDINKVHTELLTDTNKYKKKVNRSLLEFN